jgi:Rap guanine nucleotide exchange factor 2
LKPIGAEEFIQYFHMKAVSEEARTHPNRDVNMKNVVPIDSSSFLSDEKSTSRLEAYFQWSNQLTFFVASEILKHTQRRTRQHMIQYFLQAAARCLVLNNFNSLFAILGE